MFVKVPFERAEMRMRLRGKSASMFERCLRVAQHPSSPYALRASEGREIGVPFLLGTFLWASKEKYLARGCENPLPIILQIKIIGEKVYQQAPQPMFQNKGIIMKAQKK